jgi:hypothetical protein
VNLHDATDKCAIREHVEIVVVPLGGYRLADARLRSSTVIRQDAGMSQLTESYIPSIAESTAPGQPATGAFTDGRGAHGHRFGNGGRPACAWSADRARGHLSDHVLSFRMSKSVRVSFAIGEAERDCCRRRREADRGGASFHQSRPLAIADDPRALPQIAPSV